MESFLNGAPVVLRQQHRIAAPAVDLHRLMGLPHLIDHGVQAPAGFRGRHSGHGDLGERTQNRELTQKPIAIGLVLDADNAWMSPSLLASVAGGLAGPDGPGPFMLRRRQGLNVSCPGGQPLHLLSGDRRRSLPLRQSLLEAKRLRSIRNSGRPGTASAPP